MKTLREEIKESLAKGETLPMFGVRMAKEHDYYVNTPQYYKVKKEVEIEIEIDALKEENARLRKKA